MCNWRRWWIGLPFLAGLALIMLIMTRGPIESDLTARSLADLAAVGQPWASVTVEGRDASIAGTAPDEGAQRAAREAVMRVHGVRDLVADRTALPAVADPFLWRAVRDGNAVRLSGAVPNAAVRTQLLDSARKLFAPAEVVDQMDVRRGSPPVAAFAAAAEHGLSQLAKLASGAASLSGMALTVEGKATDSETYRAVVAAVPAGVPQGFTGSSRVLPPTVSPWQWSATREPGRLAVGGFVPDEAARTALLEAARAAVPTGTTVTDTMQLAEGVPANFGPATAFALGQLGRLEQGTASLVDRNLTLAGRAGDRAPYDAVIAAVTAPPADVVVARADIAPPVVRPYTLSAVRTADGVTLTGHVPSAAARTALRQAAATAFPGMTVNDRTVLAEGAPPTFAAATAFGLAQLGRLPGGEMRLSDQALTVAGRAPDPDTYLALTGALASPPQGVSVRSDITPALVSPYTFAARRTADGVTLTGFVPSTAAREALLAAAGRAFPNTRVTDQTVLADGAPPSFAAASAYGLAQLGRLPSGDMRLSDQALTVTGRAPDSATYAAVIGAIAAPPQGVTMRGEIAPPVVSPYTLSALKAADGVTLTGHVPSAAAREALLAVAGRAFPNTRVTDQTVLADGAPAPYAAASAFGLAQLGRLTTGEMRLSDAALTVTGRAPDPATYAAVTGAIGTPPQGVTARGEILPPVVSPYTLSAMKAPDGVTLTGHVPSAAARQALLAAAGQAFPNMRVTDQTVLADGAPATYAAASAFGLAQLGRLTTGEMRLSDAALTVTGRAPDFAVLDGVTTAVASPPRGVNATATIEPPVVRPFEWNAAFDGRAVTLDGVVPSQAAKEALVAEARGRFPGATVTDRTRIAAGAPAGDWLAVAKLSLGRLGELTEGRVTHSDTAISITGRGRDAVGPESIARSYRSLPDPYRLTENAVVATAVRPYRFEAAHSAPNTVTLTGHVPDDAARAAVLAAAAAALPGTDIVDRLAIAAGVPEGVDWTAATRFALGEAARLTSGSVTLAGAGYTIEGTARDPSAYVEATRQARGTLPAGLKLDTEAVRFALVAPYTFEARRENGAGVKLTGHYPDERTRNAIVEATRARFPGEEVADQMLPAAGAPQNYTGAVQIGLGALARLGQGAASIVGNAISVTGEALTPRAVGEIESSVAANAPQGFTVAARVTLRAAGPSVSGAECQRLVTESLDRAQIQFESGSADIKADSAGLLDLLTFTLQRCSGLKVEVGGHTDSAGSDTANQRLSERRAQAVVRYLAESGVVAERLTAVGYGETRPIASNDTAEGMARNRRIEFKVEQ